MTIESGFLDKEDPEEFAASIETNPCGIKGLVENILKKFNKKDSWESRELSVPPIPKKSLHDVEY